MRPPVACVRALLPSHFLLLLQADRTTAGAWSLPPMCTLCAPVGILLEGTVRTRAERGLAWHRAFAYLEPLAKTVGSHASYGVYVRWSDWEQHVGPKETTRSALVRALDEIESIYGVIRIGSDSDGFRLGVNAA